MYIFGYGSLINSASRQRTGQTGQAIPAIAHNLVRYWGKIDDSYTLAPLAVRQGEGQVNGVLLEIDDIALAEFDRRERGYQRIQITTDQIETPNPLPKDETIWVYVKETLEPPCELSPIMQTYVDTVLAGCLNISTQFAQHFIKNTIGWHYPLENDRHSPKYNNLAGVETYHQQTIDTLLSEIR